MASGSLEQIIGHLRKIVLSKDESLTDSELLQCFLDGQEEAAFAALMRRHATMVMSVCRRILQNAHDAEDAFQATFLVLVVKAASLVGRKTVGDWLFGVAYHTALKARAAALKRRSKEQQVKGIAQENTEDAWRELQPILDRELERLPSNFREAIVLCDLEGKSRKDAARILGWPEGTLSGRLARARELLSKRLARHGFIVSAGMLGATLAQHAGAACASAALSAATIKAAMSLTAGHAVTSGFVSAKVLSLTQGVLKAMLISKFKIAAFALMAIVLLTFGTFVLDAGSAQEKQGKGKDAMNPKIVEIDLSKLPPDLAKRLGEFARTKDNEDKPDEPKKSSGFQGEPQGQHEVGAEGKKKAKKEEAAQSKNKGKEDRDEDKQDRKRRRKSKRDEDERTSFQQNQKDDGNKNQEGETKVPLDKLPKAVLDSVKVKFPAAKLIGASTEKDGDKTVYEVTLTYKGHHHDVTVEPGGKILDIEKQIARKDLPAAIDAAVERKYPKATWKRVEELSKGDGKLTGYEVLLISATKETWEVLLDPMGKITKEEKKTTKKDAK